ncbi:pectinesterase inhibitor-like [Magnolia sinica]|uniref:pectinesterase inhibitor-like n=1 Tax=Magnolia sinica TaxID=86752 RepID=UPI00265A7EC5|nr:pectinesterase inhibitor-like [Magnolia sinica]
MEPRTSLLLYLSSLLLFHFIDAQCVDGDIKRRMFPAEVQPTSCNTDVIIREICEHTKNPDVCISSISPYLPNIGDVDATTILGLQIKACTNYTNVAISAVEQMVKDPKTPPLMMGCLKVCRESYGNALNDLQSAVKAIEAHDSGTLNSMLSAVLTDIGTCEDAFTERPGLKSPMASQDNMLSKLASNCLAIAALIK